MQYKEVHYEELVRHYYGFYSGQYDVLSKKQSPIVAISNLSTNKKEIKEKTEELENKIKELLKHWFKEKHLPYSMYYLSKSFKQACGKIRPTQRAGDFSTELAIFQDSIKPYFKPQSAFPNFIEELFYSYWSLILFSTQLATCMSVINDALLQGYPSRFERKIEELLQNIEKPNLGRPKDDILPQEKVEQKVLELSKDERYLKNNSKLKPTTVTDYLLSHPEFENTLSRSQLFERVKEAQKTLKIR